MEKKNVLGLGLLLGALVVIGGSIYYLYTTREEDTIDEIPVENLPVVEKSKGSEEYEDLNLEYEYKEDNTWEYIVTGTLPNPCYKITTESIVAESYPEQVTVKAIVTPPAEDEICAQAIKNVNETGEFQASEEAFIAFQVE